MKESKFILTVKSNEHNLLRLVTQCLLGYFIQSQITVVECSEPQQAPMIETGVLKSPAEIAGCPKVDTLEFTGVDNEKYYLNNGNPHIGKRISISDNVFPVEFYNKESISAVVDWARVNEGDLVEVVDSDDKRAVGWVSVVIKSYVYLKHYELLASVSYNLNTLKSIRIIEKAEVQG